MRKQRRIPQVDPPVSAEAYLAWVEDWRDRYKNAAVYSRKSKQAIRQPHNQGSPHDQARAADAKHLANEMMLDRDEMTCLARAHWIMECHRKREAEARDRRVNAGKAA